MSDAARSWHALPVADVVAGLKTDDSRGLSEAEAEQRIAACGANRLARGERAAWTTVLFRQFQNVLIVILLIAAGISFAIGHVADGITILAIVVLNGFLGFAQEWKAERTLEALRSMLAPLCRVTRDGREVEIKAERLVPGDVVHLSVGNRVPADVRLLTAQDLEVDEASLTGESDAVAKQSEPVDEETDLAERSSMAWMGTTVTRGAAKGLVVATGMRTQFGEIARMTRTVVRHPTPLQRKLARLGRMLGLAGLVVSFGIAAIGALGGRDLLDMFMTGVSLAVAVVPEGLPAVVTITLALGVRSMTRRRALIRRLQAPEALGSATVICADKTGTLTQSQMTVRRVWTSTREFQTTGVGYDPAGHYELDGQEVDATAFGDLVALLEAGQRCNRTRVTREGDAWRVMGAPTEGALLVAAYKASLPEIDLDRPGTTPFPFDSTRKRMSVVEDGLDGRVAYVKGAPDVLLERTSSIFEDGSARPIRAEDVERVEAAMNAMADAGLRTLAIAMRRLDGNRPLEADEAESELTLLGVVGMLDPPREGVEAAVALARGAGVRTIMITGDAPATALAIARQVGLDAERAITGADLAQMDDAALAEALKDRVLFARTTPEHKLRIVEALQREGEIVGMTGDGVNDAPALKKADIGIAMGIRGTDVATGAADIILTDDNYASIVNAVEEGRRQFANIQRFVRYLLSSNLGEVLAILVNILLGGPLILVPVQILWMNLVTDSATAIALGVEPVGRNAMRGKPRDPRAGILDAAGVRQILLLGGYIGIVTVVLFYAYLNAADERMNAVAQTIAFTAIIVAEKVNVLNFRVLRGPITSTGFFSNPWLLVALVGMLALQACAVYVPFLQDALHTVPLRATDWLLIFGAALPIFFLAETVKRLKYGSAS